MVHFGWEASVELESHVSLWENVTATAAANPLVAYNRERITGGVSGVVVTHTPTGITTGSVLIREAHLGTGKTAGGSTSDGQEFVLKQNTKYLLRIANSTDTTNYISVRLNWYERVSL
jgi:hypothetical protein